MTFQYIGDIGCSNGFPSWCSILHSPLSFRSSVSFQASTANKIAMNIYINPVKVSTLLHWDDESKKFTAVAVT